MRSVCLLWSRTLAAVARAREHETRPPRHPAPLCTARAHCRDASSLAYLSTAAGAATALMRFGLS
jgi:hypothetical protein